ncbi:MAG: sugar transferase [Chloroflexota bacterium]
MSRLVYRSSRWRLHTRERRTLLLIGDFLVSLPSLVFALYIWAQGDLWFDFSLDFLRSRPAVWFYFLPIFWIVVLIELYDVRRAEDWRQTLLGVVRAALIGLVVYMLFYFTAPPKSLPRRGFSAFLVTASVLTLLWRWIYIKVFTAPAFMRRVLVVGAGELGQKIVQVINELRPPPFFVVGVLDDDPQKIGKELLGHKILDSCDRLLEVIEQEDVSDVLVAIGGQMRGRTFQNLLDAQEGGVEIIRMPVMYEELLGRVPIHHLEADWILRSFVDETRVSGFYLLAKRLVDFAGGLVGLGILVIIFPLVGLITLIESGWPVVFSQTRSGRGGRQYKIFKFRTMHSGAEVDGEPKLATENDERTTRFGRFLRKTHLDEWPQFLNVLSGEMSLVGPRPERPEYVEKFSQVIPFYRARLLVKPGIAGWAQINFGYAASVEEMATKLEYDLYYIKHRNLIMDLIILLRTFGTIFGYRGL